MAQQDTWKGMAAGIIGGLAAAWIMNAFQSVISNQEKKSQAERHQKDGGEPEPANEQAAQAVAEGVFSHHLTGKEKKAAGQAAHYLTGAASGGVYGALAELLPAASAGAGSLFGAAVWLVADEISVPALGFSRPPTEYPVATHAQALASHVVYGISTDLIRRGLLKIM